MSIPENWQLAPVTLNGYAAVFALPWLPSLIRASALAILFGGVILRSPTRSSGGLALSERRVPIWPNFRLA